MRYSAAFRNNILRKVLPPQNQSVIEVSKETGIAVQTIYSWIKRTKNGTLDPTMDELKPSSRSPSEKLSMLLSSKEIPEDKLGEWLRENGLHSEHLNLWEQELRETLTNRQRNIKEENKQLKKKNRALEKELNRKEKALAEMAALMTLKKKADEIWGEEEDG